MTFYCIAILTCILIYFILRSTPPVLPKKANPFLPSDPPSEEAIFLVSHIKNLAETCTFSDAEILEAIPQGALSRPPELICEILDKIIPLAEEKGISLSEVWHIFLVEPNFESPEVTNAHRRIAEMKTGKSNRQMKEDFFSDLCPGDYN